MGKIQVSHAGCGMFLSKKITPSYLFNGQLKRNQDAQYAVLDIPVGRKDLQQCADAVMRMRASWLYSQGRYDEIKIRR